MSHQALLIKTISFAWISFLPVKRLTGVFKELLKKRENELLRKKLKSVSEIKFHDSDEKTRLYVLQELAEQEIEIVVLVADKEGKKVKDNPENYGIIVGAAVAELLKIHPALNLTVDKKFTNTEEEGEFIRESQSVAIKLAPKGVSVSLNSPVDSKRDRQVQLADFVAGAFNSKYNRKDCHYTEIIKNKVKVEKVVKWVDIKKRMVKP